MTKDIQVLRHGAVQVIRINRPEKKNALTSEMYLAIGDALDSGDTSPEITAHVIAGSGGIFCAGNDIGDFLSLARGSGERLKAVLAFIRSLPSVKKPMIAAVDGLASGVGTTMLMHCDLVYASPTAQFHTPFLNLGLVPEAGSSYLGPRIFGPQRAFELLVLGEPMSAARAEVAGLVNAIVPAAELEAKAIAAASALAKKPPEALAIARRLVRGDTKELLAAMDNEIKHFTERLKSPEAIEAFTAFFEKRAPDFAKVSGKT